MMEFQDLPNEGPGNPNLIHDSEEPFGICFRTFGWGLSFLGIADLI